MFWCDLIYLKLNNDSILVNRKLQIKPRKFEFFADETGEAKQRCTEVQLILKWGGSK